MRIHSRNIVVFLPALMLIALWQVYVMIVPKSEFFLGSPTGIFAEFLNLLLRGDLLTHFGVTITEAILGFLFGTLIGTITGLLLWFSESTYKIAKPYLIILGSLPVFALGPILIFWFGTGMLSKVIIGFLSTFVIAVSQAYIGTNEVDKNLITLMNAFGASKQQVFEEIVLPSSVIWVLSGIRINISMALLGAFVGEFISSKMGIGHLIIVSEGLFNVNAIWVGIFCLVLIALIFNILTTPIEFWAKRWK
jgi:NitT/TauT family transport system permease protein